jgi:hypothetical protein
MGSFGIVRMSYIEWFKLIALSLLISTVTTATAFAAWWWFMK